MAKLKERSVLSGILVREVMRRQVVQLPGDASVGSAVQHLLRNRSNALLVTDGQGHPSGVVSKTDLILAYHHGQTPEDRAGSIMNSPVHACRREDWLSDALRLMLIKDVQRLFVHGNGASGITGVLSLSDAAQYRSGTCRACLPSRMMSA